MIIVSIKMIILLYLCMSIFEIRNIHIYNLNTSLIVKEEHITRDNVHRELESLSPILLKNIYKYEITIATMLARNNGYMIQDQGKFISLLELSETYQIYENEKIVSDLKIDVDSIFTLLDNKITTNRRSYLSLYGKPVQSIMLKNSHNLCAFTSSSTFTFHLFTPKHYSDIAGKELSQLHKWAIKVVLNKGDVLYLPSEWNYCYEGSGNLLKCSADTYFSVFYNLVRE